MSLRQRILTGTSNSRVLYSIFEFHIGRSNVASVCRNRTPIMGEIIVEKTMKTPYRESTCLLSLDAILYSHMTKPGHMTEEDVCLALPVTTLIICFVLFENGMLVCWLALSIRKI